MLAICNICLTKLKMITLNKCSLALILAYQQHPLGHYECVLVKLCHFICIGFFLKILIIDEIEI